MKILLIQFRRLGDVLLSTPAISYLKQAMGDVQIDFLVEPPGSHILETHPLISHLHIYDKKHPISEIKKIRKEKYDVVFDFMNNPRSRWISALSGAATRVGLKKYVWRLFYNLGFPEPHHPLYVPLWKIEMIRFWLNKVSIPDPEPVQVRPQLFLKEEDEQFSRNWIMQKNLKDKNFAIVVPTHRHPIRRWRQEGFQKICLDLHRKKGLRVFLAWGPGEESFISQIQGEHKTEIEILPLTTMRQMGAIFKKAQIVLTNDSGPMHVAVAVGTPTVTIYGPTRPIDWNPSLSEARKTPHDIPLHASEVDCLGCHLLRCPIGHLCMTKLMEEKVFETCETLLKTREN